MLKFLSIPHLSRKPPKIFTPNAIKNLESWRSEWGQLDKLRIGIEQSTQAATSRLFLLEEHMVPECRHIKTSGGKCGSPALRGRPYCYYHSRLKERAAQPRSPSLAIELPASLEDRGSIQLALSEIVTAIAESRIDPRRAGILLYALQIASSNAKHQDEIVCADAVAETVVTEQGEEMALEGAKAGPPQEESLATLLIKEVRRQREENQQLSPDRDRQPAENKEDDQKGEGEGYPPHYRGAGSPIQSHPLALNGTRTKIKREQDTPHLDLEMWGL